MDGELIKTVMGAGGVATMLLAIIGGIIKLIQNKWKDRREDDLDDRDWNALYRSYAEQHLEWDNLMRADVLDLRNTVDYLLRLADKEPRVWPAIPKAPELFPKRITRPDSPE